MITEKVKKKTLFLLAKDTYNLLPGHVKAIDVATIKKNGSIKSVEDEKDYLEVVAPFYAIRGVNVQ